MKRGLSLIIIMFLALGCWAQTQQGMAYRYNGKNAKTPLNNVTITYDGNKRTAISAENGSFALILVGRKLGDRIGTVTVKKREMMVFNQQAVDEWSVRKEPLTLILCNADEFEKQKENLINIGRREAKKKYDQQKAELEARLKDCQIKEAEYEAALDKAYEELEHLQKNIGEYADLFARIDESEIDTLAQKAVELYNQGEVERAIELFEQGNYMEKLDKAIVTSQQADQLMTLAEETKEQAAQDSIKAIQSLKAQIEAYKVKNEWQKASELLKGLADRLNTVEDCWEYADFCDQQNNFKDGIAYYQRAIILLDQHNNNSSEYYLYKKEPLENSLAILYMKTYRFEEAEKMYLSALENYQRFAAIDPDAYENGVAIRQNNLAILYHNTQRLPEAEKMFLLALEIYQRLAASNPEKYEFSVAATQNNLAILYSNTQRFDEAEKMYLSTLEIRQRLAASNPDAYENDLAMTLDNLANLYYDTQRYKEAEKMYLSALEIRQRLASSNSEAYEPEVAKTQNNLANLYFQTERLEETEDMYLSVLKIYQHLATSNPEAYEPFVANTQDNLAILYAETLRFEEAEKIYLSAKEIQQRLAAFNPRTYELDLANTLFLLGFLYQDTHRYAEAFHMFYEAMEIYKRFSKQKDYDDVLSHLRKIYLHFQESGGVPKECEAEVEKFKRILRDSGC